jgi:hypothetical protein
VKYYCPEGSSEICNDFVLFSAAQTASGDYELLPAAAPTTTNATKIQQFRNNNNNKNTSSLLQQISSSTSLC